MKFELIFTKEGLIEIDVPNSKKYKLTSKMPVFFNPVQSINRDISVILIKALNRKLEVLDLLAATGVRGLRIAKETNVNKVYLNDGNPAAVNLIVHNANKNNLISKIEVTRCNANKLLSGCKKWDYIDVDPFGTPIDFLENAVTALKKNGILGVTATDTSALCGSYPHASIRKYQSKSLRNEFMHETGTRILLYKIINEGLKQKLSLTPIFVHSSYHFMRAYVQNKGTISSIKKNIGYLTYCTKCLERKTTKSKPKKQKCKCGGELDWAGPLWLGELWDKKLTKSTLKISKSEQFGNNTRKLLDQITAESKISSVGFYDLHKIAQKYKLKETPSLKKIIKALQKKKYLAERTHFSLTGLKTNATLKEILKIIK